MTRSSLLAFVVLVPLLQSSPLVAEPPLLSPQDDAWVGIYMVEDFVLGRFEQVECEICGDDGTDAFRELEVFDVTVESRCAEGDCESSDDTQIYFLSSDMFGDLELDGHTVLLPVRPAECNDELADCGPTDHVTTTLSYLLIEVDGDFCDPNINNDRVRRLEAMQPPLVKAELLCFSRQEIAAEIETRRECERNGDCDSDSSDDCSALSSSSSGLLTLLICCLIFWRRRSSLNS